MTGGALLLDEPFVAVNPSLIRATGSASRAIVLQTLWFARDREDDTTTMTLAEVAERTGLSTRTVERATVWLRQAGVLTRAKVGAFDHTSVWAVAPSVLAILTGSNPPNGETEPDKVADSDSDKVAESSSKNDENKTPTGSNLRAVQEPVREDVERLCTHLADRVERNGSKRPTITRAWRDAARLMLDRDDRTEDQVHRAIDFCQDDPFWMANVLSMPKLRQQYDRLRLLAQQRQGSSRDRQAGATGSWEAQGGFFGQGAAR